MVVYYHSVVTPRGPSLAALLLLLLVLAGVCALPVCAQSGNDWGIANQQLPWRQGSEGLAADGACYGMVRAKLEFQRLGLGADRSFTAATTPKNGSQRLFVEQFAALAQNYAMRNRDFDKEVFSTTRDPQAVDRSLAAHGANDGTAQILILSNRQAVERDANDANIPEANKAKFQAHAVIVVKREETDGAINYTVSDPNLPGTTRTVSLDKGSGQFLGLGGYDTAQHDTTELPAQNRQWLDALIKGATRPEKEQYLPVWRGNQELPKSDADYLRERKSDNKTHIVEPPTPSAGLDKKMSVLQPDKVGGVRLYFDPAIETDVAQAPARWAMVHELVEQITAGRENFLLQAGGPEQLEAVRLSAILNSSTDEEYALTGAPPTLGGLTRVLGFTRNLKTGEIFLLGRREPDRAPISLDVFTVALQTIWKQQRTPAVSLDPNPDDFFGPQHVRTVDLPDASRATEFTRIMLEADYAMKRIMLGEDNLDIAGYKSHYALLVDNPAIPHAEYERWWLYPKETDGADVYLSKSDELETCYFESDVMVLTESMKRAARMLVGTGAPDELGERTSRLFTDYYPQIEARRPVFAALHGLFDVAKLAAVLKLRAVQNALLEQAAKRTVARVEIPDAYQGIGPKIIPDSEADGMFFYIGGGVQTKAGVHPGDVIPLDTLLPPGALQPLANTEENVATLALDFPTTLPLDPGQARHVNSEMEASIALGELMNGAPETALARIDAAVLADPASVRARSVRAIAEMINGKYAVALHDANLLLPSAPMMRVLRGRIRLYTGDRAGALEDVRASAAAYPDDADMLVGKTWVLIQTGAWEEAERDLARLAVLAPLDPEVDNMRKDLRIARRKAPQVARAFFQSRLTMPLTTLVKLAHVQTLLAQGEEAEGLRLTREILHAAEQHPAAPGDPLYLQERCWVLLAVIYAARKDPQERRQGWAYLNLLAKRHPTWPTPLLQRINSDDNLPIKEAIRRYKLARAMPKDPFLLEYEVLKGGDQFADCGFRLCLKALGMARDDASLNTPAYRAFYASVLAALPEGTARYLLHLGANTLLLAAKQQGKPFDAATGARMEKMWLSPPALPAHPDAVNLYALENGYLHTMAEAVVYGKDAEDRATVNQLFRILLHGLNVEWDLSDTLERAAKDSLTTHTLYAQSLANQLKAQPEVVDAVKGVIAGTTTQEELLTTLDQAAVGLIAQLQHVPAASHALLRVALFSQYNAIVEPADLDGIKARVLSDEESAAQQLAQTPAGLVASRTAALWFEQEAGELISRHFDPEAVTAVAIEFHRASGKMNRVFAAKMARG